MITSIGVLLTVADILTTCAMVIFRVKVSCSYMSVYGIKIWVIDLIDQYLMVIWLLRLM